MASGVAPWLAVRANTAARSSGRASAAFGLQSTYVRIAISSKLSP